MSLNKVMIIGHLGKEPEMRYTPKGKPATSFSVAVNNGSKEYPHTEWFNVVTYGTLAENCKQYLVKGQQVYVEGPLQTREWTDEQGQKRRFTELKAQQVQFLSKPNGSNGNGAASHNQPAPVGADIPEAEDDIPF